MGEDMESGARPEQPAPPADTVHTVSSLPGHASPVQRRETKTMSDFFDAKDVGESTMKLMKEYDQDGDGTFSKSEVLNIVNDLRVEFKSNKVLTENNLLLKRLLIGAVVFFLLLVASIFGLSFAVAALTKETSVDAKGQLYTADGSQAIATNARADHFVMEWLELDGFGCMTWGELETIKQSVLDGHNVVVQSNQDETGTNFVLEQLSSSGAIYNEERGMTCFPMPEKPGQLLCFFPAKEESKCNTEENRRRLHLLDNIIEVDGRHDYDGHRELDWSNWCEPENYRDWMWWCPTVACQCTCPEGMVCAPECPECPL